MAASSKFSAERSEFSARLVQTLATVRGIAPSPTVVARAFNAHFNGKPVTVHAVRKWLVGESIPTQDKLRALAHWLDTSLDWLRFGESSATRGGTAATPVKSDGSPMENLVRLYLSLPHRERLLAREFITMLRKTSVPLSTAALSRNLAAVGLDDGSMQSQSAEQYE